MKKLFALLFISMISGMIMAQIPEVSGTIVFKKDGAARRWGIGERIRNRYQHHHRRRRTFYFKRNPRKGTENTGKIHRYATQRRKNKSP